MPSLAWFALTVIAVIAADQMSKRLVLGRLKPNQPVRIGSGIRLQRVNGPGWLPGSRSPARLLLIWGVAIASGLLVLELAGSTGEGVAGAGVAVALGGATGNLLDQLRRGHIVDFIGIGAWPVFNVADAGIVAGIGLTLMATVL